jgi:hypothetical protein
MPKKNDFRIRLTPEVSVAKRRRLDQKFAEAERRQRQRLADDGQPGSGPDTEGEAVPPIPLVPIVVGFSKASVPATESVDYPFPGATIPVVVGVVSGDRMLVVFASVNPFGDDPPVGWTRVDGGGFPTLGTQMFEKIAGASEPASYDWIQTLGEGFSKSGCMIAIRGGSGRTDISPGSAAGNGPSAACPNKTAGAVPGDLWVGFIGMAEASSNNEDFTTTGPHVLGIQHISEVLGNSSTCAISTYPAGLAANQVMGAENAFVDGHGSHPHSTFSVIIHA